MLRTVTTKLVEELVKKAKVSPRKRAHYLFHQPEEMVQRMVNAMARGTYVPPHKHENPSKSEHFIILKGEVALVSHDDEGKVAEVIILKEGGPVLSVDISPGTNHMFVCLSEVAAMVEIVEGPFDPKTHKQFAPFAPVEGTAEAESFVRQLESLINEKYR